MLVEVYDHVLKAVQLESPQLWRESPLRAKAEAQLIDLAGFGDVFTRSDKVLWIFQPLFKLDGDGFCHPFPKIACFENFLFVFLVVVHVDLIFGIGASVLFCIGRYCCSNISYQDLKRTRGGGVGVVRIVSTTGIVGLDVICLWPVSW